MRDDTERASERVTMRGGGGGGGGVSVWVVEGGVVVGGVGEGSGE